MGKDEKARIKIIKNGPYRVSGHVKLTEKIIVPKGHGYLLQEKQTFTVPDTYILCRCGRTKTPPFCDGSHGKRFTGTETASRVPYDSRSKVYCGPDLDMKDDGRCAFARFCHREGGIAWELVKRSDDPHDREEAIAAAVECPAGRLVPVDKDDNELEPVYEPEIAMLQDPQKGVSSGIFVKGKVEIEASDGFVYETRNRVMLCRCGASINKPFCDASHVSARFRDE